MNTFDEMFDSSHKKNTRVIYNLNQRSEDFGSTSVVEYDMDENVDSCMEDNYSDEDLI
jgi:hypothetical protein